MKTLIRFFQVLYYYMLSSYEIWRVKRNPVDDLVYTTEKHVRFEVYPGSKRQSQYDFIVKFREPLKRVRTPAHVHLIVEMYVKHAFNPGITLKLRDHILTMLSQLQPVSSFPPALQYFRPEHVQPFMVLDNVGEFSVEFMLVAIELIGIQEKTNYPTGTSTESLYKAFGVKDRFTVIQGAVFRGKR